MTTYRDKRNGRWRFGFMFEGGRHSGSAEKTSNTKRRAQELEDELRGKLERRQFTGAVPLVKDFAERLLEYDRAHHGALTVRLRTTHLKRHIVPRIGGLRLDQIDKEQIDGMVMHWRGGGAEVSTCNGRLDTLRRMLTLAQEWKIITAPKVKKLKEPESTPRFLTEEEAALLLAALPEKWKGMGLVALRTGLRVGELRGLRWNDVDLVSRQIQVRRTDPGRNGFAATSPKGKRERTVPFSPDAAGAFTADFSKLPAAHRLPVSFVWPGTFSRSRLNYDRCRSEDSCVKTIRNAATRAGIQGTGDDAIGWHTLRHTYASWLVMRGVSLRKVQRLLGHSKIEQTEIYVHLSPNDTYHAEVDNLDFRLVRADYKQIPARTPEPDGSDPE